VNVLLDTNVLSELLRSTPDASVTAWVSSQPLNSLFTSTITQAEMLYGAMLLPDGRRRRHLQQALVGMFNQDFSGRILSFDSAAATIYARIASERRLAGRPISAFDAQIAAIALAGDHPLATRNLSDFEGAGLRLINPWAE
jgi:predicted nucleic acid-binding protein